jgi:ubiquinone/menaquinone biosynthesis C-methylase UbiE
VARISAEYERRDRQIPADFYSWSRPANLLMHQQTLRSCLRLLTESGMFPLNGRRVADIGCGCGNWLREFIRWGADPTSLSGIDLMPSRVDHARQILPQSDIRLGSADQLPWPDQSFDLVTVFLVFMNLFDPVLKRAMAKEMLRIIKPNGAILWFESRVGNPRNPNIRGLRRSEIRSLFPSCRVELRPTLLAPPLSRLLAKRAWPLAELLHALPFLCTHYAGLIRNS